MVSPFLAGAEEVVVFQEVGQHERGDKQRAQQHLIVLISGAVGGIGADALVLVIGRRQLQTVRDAVVKAAFGNTYRIHDHVRRNRPVAVEAFTHRQTLNCTLDDLGKAPGRHVEPLGRTGGEKVPVAQVRGFAEGGVGNVVGGQRQAADAQQCFARLQLRHRLGDDANLIKVLLVILQLADHSHGRS